jgi:hypothetical protein
MKLAIEDNKNNIGFFKIDGRYLKRFIQKAVVDIEDLKMIWSYSHKERLPDSSISSFNGIKVLYEKHKNSR